MRKESPILPLERSFLVVGTFPMGHIDISKFKMIADVALIFINYVSMRKKYPVNVYVGQIHKLRKQLSQAQTCQIT